MTTRSATSPAQSAGKSSSQAAPLAALKSLKKRSTLTWNITSPEQLVECIAQVLGSGALLSFSMTSDQGAVCIYVKDGNESEKLYAANDQELDEKIQELHAAYFQMKP